MKHRTIQQTKMNLSLFIREKRKRKESMMETPQLPWCKMQSAVWGGSTGLFGSRNSLNRQTSGSTLSSGERKKNKPSSSFCSFFSRGWSFVSLASTLLTHAAPERHQRCSEGVNQTLSQCIPSFPLSFCLSLISFLLMGGGGLVSVLLELEKTKTLEGRETKRGGRAEGKINGITFDHHKWTA